MTVYGTTLTDRLYDEIIARSTDLRECLALLSEYSKLGAEPTVVMEVRKRLWTTLGGQWP